MSDEKTTIYISPEDDLTSLRERLEKIPARSITLVIPTQSQLRSHVAWKLLRARSRELGKEILIVSTDPQIRSVAQAVKFKVAHSLESSPTGKSRPPSRPGRAALGNRGRPTGSIQRPASARGASDLRGTGSMRPPQPDPGNQWSPSSSDRSFAQPESDENYLTDAIAAGDIHDIDPSAVEDDHFDTPDKHSYDFRMNTSPPIHPLSQQQLEEEPDLLLEDFHQAQNIREAASQKGASEPDDMDYGDYGEYSDGQSGSTSSAQDMPPEDSPQNLRMTPLPRLGDDPFASMDDALPPPAAEQRGSVPAVEGFDTREHTIQNVSDMPTDVLHGGVEYQGDQGDFVVDSDTPSPARPWSEPLAEDDQDRAGPARTYNRRRSSRTGRQPAPPASPVGPGQDYGSYDALPPIPDRPTQETPQAPSAFPPLPSTPAASGTSSMPRISRGLAPGQVTRASGNLPPNQVPRKSGGLPPGQVTRASGNLPPNQSTRASGNLPPNQISRMSGGLAPGQVTRASGNLPPNQPARASGNLPPNQMPRRDQPLRQVSTPRSGNNLQQQTPTRNNRPALSRPVPRQGKPTGTATRQGPPSRASARPAPQRRRASGSLYIVAAIALVIIGLGLAAYLLPSANVTVTLPSSDYSAPVKIVASRANKSDVAAGIIQDETLRKDFTMTGTGKATGSTKIGTAAATGLVFFTNNGSQQVIIPSGISVSTNNGIEFVTQAEVSVGPKGSSLSRLPTQIQAQTSGDSGNVPEGSITSIRSLNTIAQRNGVQPASLSLQVTNDAAITGGGAGTATSVTQKDLDTAQTALSTQLQSDINSWIKQQLQSGDVAGKPVLTPTLTNAPKVNDIEQNTTFPVSLKQSVEVPVVRNATLQSAAVAQLNTALSKDKNHQNYQVVVDQQNPLHIPQFTPVSNAMTLTLNFTPTGKIIQKVLDVRSQLTGKTAGDAQATLKGIIPTIQRVDVAISPSIDPLIPLRTDHIHVKYVAGSPSPAPK